MNWGIIGYGEIAPAFIEGLTVVKSEHLVAIASVSHYLELSTNTNLQDISIYESYADLIADGNVDVVYICTVNNLHKENVLAALNGGKHVLCEKPAAINRSDLEEMLSMAKEKHLFFMEGMWTRFLPAYRHFITLIQQDKIGQINFLRADFGFYTTWDNNRRLKNKLLHGGTLLDNADYNLFLCQDVFRQLPIKINAFSRKFETEVEDMCGVMMQYANGAIAQLFSSFHQKTRQEALIYGRNGYIHLKEFWHGTTVDWFGEHDTQSWSFPFIKNGFEYEIMEVIECINNNKIESAVMSHQISTELAGLMDEIIVLSSL